MSTPATLLMWFQLRSPELAEDFERLMAGDRDVVRGSLDTVTDWRLTRPADVPRGGAWLGGDGGRDAGAAARHVALRLQVRRRRVPRQARVPRRRLATHRLRASRAERRDPRWRIRAAQAVPAGAGGRPRPPA